MSLLFSGKIDVYCKLLPYTLMLLENILGELRIQLSIFRDSKNL
jgi:hypothetical protein